VTAPGRRPSLRQRESEQERVPRESTARHSLRDDGSRASSSASASASASATASAARLSRPESALLDGRDRERERERERDGLRAERRADKTDKADKVEEDAPADVPGHMLDGVPLDVQEAWVCEDLTFVLQVSWKRSV
jgi:gamma-tubulin complex component 2